MGADWEVTWIDIIVVTVKGGDDEHGEVDEHGEDGEDGKDGDDGDGEDDKDDGEENYDDQYVCRRGRTAFWTSELCTWSDQRWHRPELVELLFGRNNIPNVHQRSISHYMRGEVHVSSIAITIYG